MTRTGVQQISARDSFLHLRLERVINIPTAACADNVCGIGGSPRGEIRNEAAAVVMNGELAVSAAVKSAIVRPRAYAWGVEDMPVVSVAPVQGASRGSGRSNLQREITFPGAPGELLEVLERISFWKVYGT